MAQVGKKHKGAGDVATIAVSLDRDKQALAGYAKSLGPDWTLLCDFKVYESRPAKDYGVDGIAGTFVLDPRGRIRLTSTLDAFEEWMVEDLRIEAFWAKKRAAEPPPAEAPKPAAAPAAAVQWIFHLKSGGKLKVVSYEEKDDKYLLKLVSGASSISKDAVDRITKADPGEK